jgi:hypothetical protein
MAIPSTKLALRLDRSRKESRPVQRDVRAHYSDVVFNLLGLWEHRGNVELYFKHRYKAFNYRIGKLTEYFAFPSVKVVLNDLYGMEAKMLSDVEVDAIGDGRKRM